MRCGRDVLATGWIEVSRMLPWADAAQTGAPVLAGAPRSAASGWIIPRFTLGEGVMPTDLTDPCPAAPMVWTFFALTAAQQRAPGVMKCWPRVMPKAPAEADRILADLARAAPGQARRLGRLAAAGQVAGLGLRAARE